MSEGKKKMIKD